MSESIKSCIFANRIQKNKAITEFKINSIRRNVIKQVGTTFYHSEQRSETVCAYGTSSVRESKVSHLMQPLLFNVEER